MRPAIDLVEWGKPQVLDLTDEEYETLSALDLVTVSRKSPHGFAVKPGRKVGSVRAGGMQVNVRPKVADIKRLLFFIGYCSNPSMWRDEFVRLEKAEGLFPAVAESFVRLASRAVEQGLLQGYTTRADRLSVIRGRVHFRDQLTKNFGLPLPVAVEFDDFTTDTTENSIVLLAALRLLSMPDIGVNARQRLSRIRLLMDDITVPSKSIGRPKWRPNRLNVRYHDVLRLSEVILDNSSFDQRNGPLAVSGFMFDMWRVYEDFVTGSISMAMRQFGGHAETQSEHFVDKASRIRFRPDLVWRDNNGSPVAVVDAKYKAERPKGFPEADLYQMLTYCSVLNLKEGHLVYAKGNEPARVHEIRNCGITIHCHALDLGLPPRELLQTIDSLAGAILHKTP
ncbi:5-methylcytosine-specific restriction enzyme subunit McrC [Nocardia transvalensis]|uniref:5-methylcytosine-specific restriction enzyme subunit McrC n=1 Tax=Nocardia transvalensis TaxID=37333 RepID=A0A7W9UFZ7_9NOCA|nr:restriction endonuclease [Nocardia transvalensis]MBB5911719.1 5-methylcytosine-specific restriction enzyme subunit McrC [Nocardia transvalensis]